MVLAGINHAQAALHQHGHQPATQYSGAGFKNIRLAYCKCLNSVLNVEALVGAFNQVKALVGAFSMIVKTSPKVRCELYWTM